MYFATHRRLPSDLLDLWLAFAIHLGAHTPSSASAMTPDLKTRSVFGSSLDAVFPPDPRWITVVSLLPSQQIVAHRDPALPPGVIRYHVPLQTNEHCWSMHEGEWQQLEVGGIYTMTPEGWHGAVNWGSVVRLHLLVDAAGDLR